MKCAVWYTGHHIADTVAVHFPCKRFHISQLSTEILRRYDAHIAYGILRGSADLFRKCDKLGIDWFNVDLGYFNPGHFDGYYRISHRGTQAKYSGENTGGVCVQRNIGTHVMICPPTPYVCEFFNIDIDTWMADAIAQAKKTGLSYFIRTKECKESLETAFSRCVAVITFNSSVGWKALQLGIPCLSDPLHSVVGSYYNTKCIDTLLKLHKDTPTKPLFEFMREQQFTLSEISKGKAWALIEKLTS